MPSKNVIAVDLQAAHRRKGLIWYPTYTCDFDGTYTITQIASNNCASDTCTQDVTVMDVGINSIANSLPLRLYPNPTRSNVTVELPEQHEALSYTLMDAQGRVVETGSWTARERLVMLDLSASPSGVYLLRVVGAQSVTHKPITLQR